MSDMAEVLNLLREFRGEMREDLKEIKAEVKKTNGTVRNHAERLKVIETRAEDDREGRKRLKDFIPQVAAIVISCSLSVLLTALVLH